MEDLGTIGSGEKHDQNMLNEKFLIKNFWERQKIKDLRKGSNDFIPLGWERCKTRSMLMGCWLGSV